MIRSTYRLALVPTLLLGNAALADVGFTQADTADAFVEAFCAADRSGAHIFMLPLAAFEHDATLDCPDGASTMRMAEPADDPGHVVLNIDPPSGVDDGFDCDAKADIGMEFVALNCLPANAEAVDHRKP